MASPTPSPSPAAAKPKSTIVDKAKPEAASPPTPDLRSSYEFDTTVQHTADGGGTRQRELKPEDMPKDLLMAPPAEQLNPAFRSSIGTPGESIEGATDEAIVEGIEAHERNRAKLQAEVNKADAEAQKA